MLQAGRISTPPGRRYKKVPDVAVTVSESSPAPAAGDPPLNNQKSKIANQKFSVSFLEDGEELFHGGREHFVLFVEGGDGAVKIAVIEVDR